MTHKSGHYTGAILILLTSVLLTACGNTTMPAWQEQYDLGMQYLTDGYYESAIVAFTSSIEIGPKLAALYIARGDAYSAWAEETEAAALAILSEDETLEWSEITVSTEDGSTYTLEELYENAISDYEEAVSLLESGEALDGSSDELLNETLEKKNQLLSRTEKIREENEYAYEEALFCQKLEELVMTYGIFSTEQSGIMHVWEDEWFSPEGIISASLLDFDSDGSLEMMVCRSENCSHDGDMMDHDYHIVIEMYEISEDSVVEACNLLFAAYNDSDSGAQDNWSELGFNTNFSYQEFIAVNAVKTDEAVYIVCEAKLASGPFADGSWQSYWILQYCGEDMQYISSFTQTEGGSSDFEFTGYDFENEIMTASALYYSELYNSDDIALYDNFGLSIREFFKKYDIDVSETAGAYLSVYEGANDLQTILDETDILTKIFDFRNILSNYDYDVVNNRDHAEFVAVLNRENNLLDNFSDTAALVSDNSDETDLTEDVFQSIPGIENVIYYFLEDFDGDGKEEAFIITGSADLSMENCFNDITIYFEASDGIIREMITGTYGYLAGQTFMDTGTSKYIIWEVSAGGSSTISMIYGVKDGEAYEPGLSGHIMMFQQASVDADLYVGLTNDWSKGYHDYIEHYYEYNADNGEFEEINL